MARIRYLKPEFFSDEDLAEFPWQTRIAFAGLWCWADKAGRLEDRPRFLKGQIFPYDNVDMEKELQRLSQKKRSGQPFIIRYETGGQRYISIPSWNEHQRPHHTEKNSIIPSPPENPPTPPLNTKEKEKGMGKEKQLEASAELNNGDLTVKDITAHKDNGKTKTKWGEFKNVLLTQEEHANLVLKIGQEQTDMEIENLSRGIESKGYKYKSHYATILNWNRRHEENRKKEAW